MSPELCDLLQGAPTHDCLAVLDYLHARRRVRAIMKEESALALPLNSENAIPLFRPIDR